MELHGHAYVGAGGESAVSGVLSWLEACGVAGGPDRYVRTFAHFGIDDARDIIERARLRGVETRRVFVIVVATITAEAQNALLKTFEEPLGNALFVLLVPSPHMLLPTLLSRMQPLELTQAQQYDSPIDAKKFLASLPAQRLDMLKVILDADERDIGAPIAFLAACERELDGQFPQWVKAPPAQNEGGVAFLTGIQAIYRARAFIADKGALIKPLLEQVALLAPVV